MLGARTAAWSGKALPYDAEVEWIKGDGNAYVKTGVIPSITTSAKIGIVDFIYSSIEFIFGVCDVDFKTQSFTLSANREDISIFRIFFSGSSLRYDQGNFKSAIYSHNNFNGEILITPNYTKVNEEVFTYYQSPVPPMSLTNDIWLFDRNTLGVGTSLKSKAKVSKFEIYDGDNLVLGFKPVKVRRGDSFVGYFYDYARPSSGPFGNGLYGNSAAGNEGFPMSLVGPDKMMNEL